jgi:hypothetical protein
LPSGARPGILTAEDLLLEGKRCLSWRAEAPR